MASINKVILIGTLGRDPEVGEYLKKGRPMYVEGRLKTRKWQDKEGKEQYTTEVVATEMQMLGGRDGAGSGADDGGAGGNAGYGDAQPRSAAPSRPAPQKPASKPATGFDAMDDDIPF